MRKRLSKRVLSLFLSVLMLATSLPFAGLTASAADLPASTDGAYLLAYFKNGAKSSGSLVGESIYFALSKDGYNFEALNTQNPVVYATEDNTSGGTVKGSGHARDPYIIRGNAADENGGKYSYMLATDDDTTGGDYSNTSLHFWRSEDMVNWEYISNIELVSQTGGDKAWAPQAIWDPTVNQYMVYWSGNCGGQDGILYAYTKDFITLTTAPQTLFKLNNGHAVIDGDITKTDTGYIMFFKDESSDQTGSKQIHYVTKTGESPSPSDGEYTQDYTPLDSVHTVKMEGPQCYNIAGTSSYVLLADKFESNAGFNAYITSDFKTYVGLSESDGDFTINQLGLSHGSVVHITDEEYTALTNAYGREVATQTNIPANESPLNHLVAQYFVKQNPAEDNSGKGNHIGDYNNDGVTEDKGAVNNLNMVVKDGRLCAQFDSNGAESSSGSRDKGSYAWIEPAKALQNANAKTGVTISCEVYFDSAPSDTHIFDFHDGADFSDNFSKFNSSLDNHNLLLFETDGQIYAYNDGDYTSNGDANFGSIPTGSWHTFTMSVTNKYIVLYMDGKIVAKVNVSRADENWFNAVFKNGNTDTSKLSIGISSWVSNITSRNYLLDGYISNFCLFDRALSEADVNYAMDLLDNAPEESYDESSVVIYKDNCNSYTGSTYTDDIYGDTLALNKAAVAFTADPVNDKADTEAENGYTYSMMYNPGDTIDSGAVFRMGDDASGTFTVNEDGTVAFRKGNDFFTTPSLFTLTENKFQYVTLQIVPYADYDRIYVYIDGKQTNMYDCYKVSEDTSTGSTYPKTSADDSTIFNLVDLIHSTYSAPSAVTYGEGATGYISDVQIVRGCANARDMYVDVNANYAEKLIRHAMDSFEAAMRTFTQDNVLTNVSAAYKLYDEASRYLDSIHYGEAEVGFTYLTELNQNLLDAVDNMQKYENGGFSTVTAQVNSKDVPAGASSNLLYIDDLSVSAYGSLGNSIDLISRSDKIERYGLYYGDAVFLYDGTQKDSSNIMALPVVYNQYLPSGSVINSGARLHGMYPCTAVNDPKDHPYFRLIGNGYNADTKKIDTTMLTCWRGYDTGSWADSVNFALTGSDGVGSDSINNNHFDKTQASDYCYSEYFQSTPPHYWYNVLQFQPETYMEQTGKDTPEGVYQLAWALYQSRNKNNTTFASASDNNKGYINKTTSSIYVVDISKVQDVTQLFNQVDDFYTKMQNITEYTSESAQALANAVDGVTNFKLSSYNFSRGTVSTVYNQLINDRDTIISNFSNASENLKMEDQGVYDQLRSDLTAGVTDTETGADYAQVYSDLTTQTVEECGYTSSSRTDLIDAYEAVVDSFTSLDPSSTNNKYITDSTGSTVDPALNPDTLHENLVQAYKLLMPRADYTELQSTYNGNYTGTNSETRVSLDANQLVGADGEQNYTLGTWLPYSESAQAAAKLAQNKDDVSAASYTKAQKLDQPKFTTDADGYRTDVQSDYQNAIDAADADLQAKINDVTAVADYTAYDAFVIVLGTQDKYAFTDDYLAGQNVFSDQEEQGSATKAKAYAGQINNAYVEYNGTIYKNADQTSLDNTTTDLVTQLNTINNDTTETMRRAFNVTFNTVLDEGAAQTVSNNKSYYGEQVVLTVPSDLSGKVYKWNVNDGTNSRDVLSSADDYTVLLQGIASENVTVTAYCDSDTKTDDQINVTILNRQLDAVQKLTMDGSAEVVLSNNAGITVAGTAYAIPSEPFYRFVGWNVNGQSYNYATYTLADMADADGNVVIKPIFQTDASNLYTITMDGVAISDPAAIYYDTKVSVSRTDGYAIAVATGANTYSIASYGTSYTFYANRSMDFYTVTAQDGHYYVTVNGSNVQIDKDAAATYNLDHQFPFVYGAPAATGDSNQNYSTYFAVSDGLPGNVTVTEVGTVYTKTDLFGGVPTEDDMVIGGTGMKVMKAKNCIDTQYIMTCKNANTREGTYYTRGYVKYTYTYETETLPGSGNTVLTEVQCIAYSDICNNSGLTTAQS